MAQRSARCSRSPLGWALLLLLALGGCGGIDVDRLSICEQALRALQPGAVAIGHTADPDDSITLRYRHAGREEKLVCGFRPRGLQSDGRSLTRVVTRQDGELSPAVLFLLNHFGLGTTQVDERPQLGRWAYLLQQLANALAPSAIYALLAAGYAVIYGVTGRINLAFGEFATVGSFAALSGVLLGAMAAGGVPSLALAGLGLAAVTGGALGQVLWALVFAPLHRRSSQALLIATIGLAIAFAEGLRLLAGSRLRWLQPLYTVPIHLGPIALSPSQMGLAILAILVVTAVSLMIRRTAFGRAYRAISDDPGAAALMGVDVDRTIARTCILGSMLAGVAGFIIAAHYGVVSFSMGTMLGLKALTAAVLGGIGSIPGAALGGLLIGLLEGLWAGYLPGAYRDVAVFVALAVMLALRPDGLLGRTRSSQQLPRPSPG